MDQLIKPAEYLPSAEIQLERREADKAAALRKENETLIERKRKETAEGKEEKLVREAVAAALRVSSGSQQGKSSKEKLILLTKDLTEKPFEGRVLQILSAGGEFGSGARAAGKGSALNGSGESATFGDAREPHLREYKRKPLLMTKDGIPAVESRKVASVVGANQRRSSGSSKSAAGAVEQSQSVLAHHATSFGDSVSSGKEEYRQEPGGRTSPCGAVEPPAQSQAAGTQLERGGKRPPRPQAIRLARKDQAIFLVSSVELENHAGNGEERSVKHASSAGPAATISLWKRQCPRRLKNKDRPDRPVWTPRRCEGVTGKIDGAASANGVTSAGDASKDGVLSSTKYGLEIGSQNDRAERSSGRESGGSRSETPQMSGGSSNGTLGKLRYVVPGGRGARGGRGGTAVGAHDAQSGSQVDAKSDFGSGVGKSQDGKQIRRNSEPFVQLQEGQQQSVTEDKKMILVEVIDKEAGVRGMHNKQLKRDGFISGTEMASKVVKSGRGPPALGANEKQVWVAIQKTVSG